jgi:hypothetical protein
MVAIGPPLNCSIMDGCLASMKRVAIQHLINFAK